MVLQILKSITICNHSAYAKVCDTAHKLTMMTTILINAMTAVNGDDGNSDEANDDVDDDTDHCVVENCVEDDDNERQR